jgi:hypothetical protein
LACLVGAAVAGCADGSAAEQTSAGQMLDDANDTMRALKSVTIDAAGKKAAGGDESVRLTTDLKDTCMARTTSAKGAVLEQIRIGKTDYVRPNRAYLEASGRKMSGAAKQNRWVKTPTSESEPGDGLAQCTQEFASFGEAAKGESVEVDGTPAIQLVVTDDADKGGTYTFYVATEGKPYILKVVYKGAEFGNTTSYSAFDEPLAVRPPAEADTLDMSGTG